jgi:hypothetical protein
MTPVNTQDGDDTVDENRPKHLPDLQRSVVIILLPRRKKKEFSDYLFTKNGNPGNPEIQQ